MGKLALWILVLLALLPGSVFSAAAETVAQADEGVSRSISIAGYQQALVKYLCNYLGKDKTNIAVTDLRVSGDKALPPGRIGFQFIPKNKYRLEGNVRFDAVIRVDGVVRNEVRVTAWVDVFELAVCTNRSLSKGEVIGPDDLYMGRRRIAANAKGMLTDIEMAVGYTAKRHLRADTCLKEWMLEKTSVVDRGDKVTVVAETGALQVTVPGRVLEKGGIGDLVKVENIMSKKKIYAKVMNSTTVVVEF